MSGHEPSDDPIAEDEMDKNGAPSASNDEMASKLSKELNNWRRKRSSGRPRPGQLSHSSKSQSEPARTIKVRGHETLVIRKSRPILKPGSDANS